jgi:hypothetical protein
MTREKTADGPIAAQLAAAILGGTMLASDRAHVQELRQNAAIMNQALREYEAQKMEQTISALDPKMAAAMNLLDDVVKTAALATIEGMDKAAFGELLGALGRVGARAGGALLKGMGGAAQAAGRLKLPTTGTQRLVSAAQGQGLGLTKAPGAMQNAAGWLSRQGTALSSTGAKAPIKPAIAAAGASTPLIGMGTKAKLLGGGALLGAGYLGMKGLQASRDYMMTPSASYGEHGAPIMHDVNQYGQAQY